MVKLSLSTDFVKLWVENGLKSKNVVIQLGSFNENAYLCRPKKSEQNFFTMARVCQVTGKKPITGNKVSHSNIKTKRRFLPNLQTKRYFIAEEDKWVTLKVSSEAIRTINKNGLLSVVKQLRAAGEKI
jgi:large subunit ribosomal protein L28